MPKKRRIVESIEKIKTNSRLLPQDVAFLDQEIERRKLIDPYSATKSEILHDALKALARNGAGPLSDTVREVFWITGPDAVCTFLSEGWLRLTGRHFEDAIGDGWEQSIHPDDLPILKAVFLDAQDKQKPFSVTYRLRMADGSYVWIDCQAMPHVSDGGVFLGFIGAGRRMPARAAAAGAPLVA